MPPTVDPMPEGFKPCAVGTQDLVVDLKGLISLPFDTDNDGMKCARALIFERGKAVHVPNVAGQYVTTAHYDVQTTPCMVHFSGGIRKPELCVSFIDFAATNGGLAGVAVESLALPLKLSGKKFRSLTNMSQVSTIVGFSPVPPGETLINIAQTLKGISPFKQFGVSTMSGVIQLIGQSLGARVPKLREHAQARIRSNVEDIAMAGDHAAAAQQEGIWCARLERMVAIVTALPPIHYDARLTSRVTLMQIKDGGLVEGRPDWLASPLKEQLLTGAAGMLQRSQFVEKQTSAPPSAAAAAAAQPDAGDAAAIAAAGIEGAADSEEESDPPAFDVEEDAELMQLEADGSSNCGGISLADDDETSPVLGKRQRISSHFFVPPEAVTKKKATVKGGCTPSAASNAKGELLNPRTGKPYARGPYKQPKATPTPTKRVRPQPDYCKMTLASSALEIKSQQKRIKELEEKLEQSRLSMLDKVAVATHETRSEMRLELQQQYMLGLQHGSMLSRGEAISLAPSSAKSGSK